MQMAYKQPPAGRQAKMKRQSTGTHDVTYDLVSILYHALQGAEIYGKYMEDADQSGENEFRSFFLEMQQEEMHRAERAKELLMKRLGNEGTFLQRKASQQEKSKIQPRVSMED
jgi:hypothetical protein